MRNNGICQHKKIFLKITKKFVRNVLCENGCGDRDVDVDVAANDESRRVADGARNDSGRVKPRSATRPDLGVGVAHLGDQCYDLKNIFAVKMAKELAF
jgi:hypothetical protein